MRDQRVQNLSTGWRQRIALATAIVHQPGLLFLDEPTSGVDPVARRAFWDLIYSLSTQGVTIMVTTHYMDEAEYCSMVGIMRAGRLLALDEPGRLKSDSRTAVVGVEGFGKPARCAASSPGQRSFASGGGLGRRRRSDQPRPRGGRAGGAICAPGRSQH